MTAASQPTSQEAWPEHELEHLNQCPVCGSAQRTLLIDRLVDKVFGVAAGEWQFWQCESCKAGYLDPRPDRASIGKAYSAYYTHSLSAAPGGLERFKSAIKRALRNDHLNATRGFSLSPALPGGRLLYARNPSKVARLDFDLRTLPPPKTKSSRLLEIGPGDGDFLLLAQELGYIAEGIEPDPKAVQVCRTQGLAVREGTMPETPLDGAAYEQVLLNHVFEHIHLPGQVLQAIWKALVPGGRLWMAMPNLQSAGFEHWGRHWMPLDPPRHVTVYSRPTIKTLLERCGFIDIAFPEPGNSRVHNYCGSWKISQGMVAGNKPRDIGPHSSELSSAIEAGDRLQAADPARAETFTVVAFKPR